MLPPLELPQPLQDVALLPPGGSLLLQGGADVSWDRGAQAQPLLPGQGGLETHRDQREQRPRTWSWVLVQRRSLLGEDQGLTLVPPKPPSFQV